MFRGLKTRRIAMLKRVKRFSPLLTRSCCSLALSIWDIRTHLTVVARLPGFKRFDRQLAWLLNTRPRFLSSRVKLPTRSISGTAFEKIDHWLWAEHSAKSSAITLILVAVDILLVAYAIGVVFNISAPVKSSSADWVSPDLLAVTGYVGAIFGFLQAVLIFAAQIRSQQNTSMLPLTSLFARKYHSFEILALAGGIAVANLVAAHIEPFLPILQSAPDSSVSRSFFLPLLGLNMILVPLVTALSLGMLARIVIDAGSTDMNAVLPVMRSALARAAAESASKMALAEMYTAELNRLGFRYSPYSGSGSLGLAKKSQPIDIGREGVFLDVDCVRLEALANRVMATKGISHVEFAALPGQDWGIDNGANAVYEQDITNSHAAEFAGSKNLNRMSKTLRGSLVIRSGGAK